VIPGDLLLYSGRNLFDRYIQIKTWSRISHCEIYDDYGVSVAARPGEGVSRYTTRAPYRVLRLRVPFDLEAGRRWFQSVDGQGYDWIGLTAFMAAKWQGRSNGKQFCSEFATRWYRHAIGATTFHPDAQRGDARALAALGLDPFNGYDADGVAPGEFLKSPLFEVIA